MKVLNLITGLSVGGSEMMLYKLLSVTGRSVFRPEVVSLTNIGQIGEKIRAMGVPVHALEMRRSVPNPVAIITLARQQFHNGSSNFWRPDMPE